MGTPASLIAELGSDPTTRRPPRLAKTARTSSTRRAWDSTENLSPRAGWKKRANCLDAPDPDLFFGQDNQLQMPKEEVEDARAWCRTCPVARDCLIYSFQNNERFGIWGSFTWEERKRTIEVTGSLTEALRHFDLGRLHAMVVRL